MQIDNTKNEDTAFQQAVNAIEKRLKSLKKRLNKPISECSKKENDAEKQADTEKPKYKSFMKVASLLLVVSFVSVGIACVYVPSVYDTILAIIEAINPFNSLGDGEGLEYFVKTLNK